MKSTNEKLALEKHLRFLYGDVLDLPLQRDQDSNLPIKECLSFEEKISSCTSCDLYLGRSQAVVSKGLVDSSIGFIGDFANDLDDQEGTPFAGAEGELLRKMILAMNLDPEKVFYTNLFKCKPPTSFELTEQLFSYCPELFLPTQTQNLKIIVALGEISSQYFSRSQISLHQLRGQPPSVWNQAKVFFTHHPRTLLKQPNLKKEAWIDLQKVMKDIVYASL